MLLVGEVAYGGTKGPELAYRFEWSGEWTCRVTSNDLENDSAQSRWGYLAVIEGMFPADQKTEDYTSQRDVP